MSDHVETIECETHGTTTVIAIVCRHMLTSDTPVGFVENVSDPDDQQAWCDACEALYMKEKSMTRKFRKFNDFAVVCGECYAGLKQRHS